MEAKVEMKNFRDTLHGTGNKLSFCYLHIRLIHFALLCRWWPWVQNGTI